MKKTIALILALVMLMSSFVFVFSSCGEEKTENKSDKDKTVSTIPSGEEGDIFAERAAIPDGLGEYDFGGRKFRVVSHRPSEFFVEEDERNQGNLIVDAKFNRNATVENRFNFETEVAYTGTYSEVIEWTSKTVLSGADEFDLYCSHGASAGGLVLKNVFLNWYDIPNIDFSKPWWPVTNSTELTYDGKCILAVSEYNFSAVTGIYCMYFNKDLAAAYDLGNLYEVALNGDWTYEYFYEIIKDIWQDDDGSGDRSEGDFYGFAQEQDCTINQWLWAFDNPTVTKNEEGIPVVSIRTEKINDIVNRLYDLIWNTNGTYFAYNGSDGSGTEQDHYTAMNMFVANKCIFVLGGIGSATGEKLRNFESEYGMLPVPKYDSNQQNYYTMAGGEHTVMAVPKTCKDTEFVGTVVEALSAETYKQVTPTFYEIALKTRYLRDSESKEVLDGIISSRTYDFGYIYDGWAGFGFMLELMLEKQNNNFESYYQKKYNTARLHYKKIVKIFDKLG